MTDREFFALKHNYAESVVQEAKETLNNMLQKKYLEVNVYVAEAHGGYVFLCATYRKPEKPKETIDESYWMGVMDGKCVGIFYNHLTLLEHFRKLHVVD